MDLEESVVDGCEISGVVVVSSIGFDSDEGNGVFLNENTLGFASFVAREFSEFFFFFLFCFLLNLFFLLLSLLGFLFLFALLCLSIIFFDQPFGFQFFDHLRNKGIVETLPEFLQSYVKSLVNHFEVLP